MLGVRMIALRGSPSANQRRMIVAALFVLALVGGLVLVSQTLLAPDAVDADTAESAAREPARVMLRDGVTIITLDVAMQQRGGIETAAAGSPLEAWVTIRASNLDGNLLISHVWHSADVLGVNGPNWIGLDGIGISGMPNPWRDKF